MLNNFGMFAKLNEKLKEFLLILINIRKINVKLKTDQHYHAYISFW